MFLDLTDGQVMPYANNTADVMPYANNAADMMPYANNAADMMPYGSNAADAYEDVYGRQQQGCVNVGCDTIPHAVARYPADPYSDYPSPEGDGSLV